MAKHDFWAIVTDRKAARRWRTILGVSEECPYVPLVSLQPDIADLPGLGPTMVYLVRLELLTAEQRSRLVSHLSEQCGESAQEVADELDARGLPIRASTCMQLIHNPQKWCV